LLAKGFDDAINLLLGHVSEPSACPGHSGQQSAVFQPDLAIIATFYRIPFSFDLTAAPHARAPDSFKFCTLRKNQPCGAALPANGRFKVTMLAPVRPPQPADGDGH